MNSTQENWCQNFEFEFENLTEDIVKDSKISLDTQNLNTKIRDFDIEKMKRRKIKSKKKKIFEGCNKREIISNWLHSNFTQHHQFANGTDGV